MDIANLKYYLKALKSKGITQKDIAKKLVLQPTYISDMANGNKPITSTFIEELKKNYGELEGFSDKNSVDNSKNEIKSDGAIAISRSKKLAFSKEVADEAFNNTNRKELAKLMALAYQKPIEQVLDELDQSDQLELSQIVRRLQKS